MIDAVRQAMSRIYNTIPLPVLEAAFKPYNSDMSLDALILQKVILARVRDDISVRGGKVLDLICDLNWCQYTASPSPYALGISGAYTVFHIPPEAREHRDISAVVRVRFPYSINTSSSGTFYNDCVVRGNTVGGLVSEALRIQTYSGMIVTPTAIVLPGNQIQLDPPQYNFVPWQIRVRLRYDDNFSGMEVSTIHPFAQICEYAVKAYIYNNLIFEIESNMVFKGADIGVMKEIVENYRDANEKYDELLIAVGGAEHLDTKRLKDILQRCIPKK